MIIKIKKSTIAGPLSQVSKAAATKDSIPILRGIYMESSGDGLTLVGSDLDSKIKITIPSDDFENVRSGKIVIPADKFSDVINKMPGEELIIEVKPGFTCKIMEGKTKLQVNGLDPAEYPDFPSSIGDEIVIDGLTLRDLIGKTVFSSASKQTAQSRPILAGVHFKIGGSRLRMTAADIPRLARVDSSIETDANQELVITAASLKEFMKIVENDPVSIESNASWVIFKQNQISFCARLLDGVYPNVDNWLAQPVATTATADIDKVASALNLALITSDDQFIEMAITEREIEIRSDGETGKTEHYIPIIKSDGPPLRFGVNAKNMLEALRAIEQTKVEFRFCGHEKPIMFSGLNAKNETFLILPKRIRGEHNGTAN